VSLVRSEWRVALLSHCLLNPGLRARGLGSPQEALPHLSRLLAELMGRGYCVLQLPCPEAAFLSVRREPATRAEYERAGLRRKAVELAESVAGLVASMASAGAEVSLLIGVAGSPSCGVRTTHVTSASVREPGAGVFVEELLSRPELRGVKALEWDFRDPEGSLARVLASL